jgi:hypothetical protein
VNCGTNDKKSQPGTMPFATVGKLHNSRQLPIKNAIELPKLQKNIFPRHKKVAMTQKSIFMISGEVLNAQKCFFAAPQKIGMA